MDSRTTMRELDEVIARAQTAAERGSCAVGRLTWPSIIGVPCRVGDAPQKQAQLRMLRRHVHRLRRFAANLRRRLGPGSVDSARGSDHKQDDAVGTFDATKPVPLALIIGQRRRRSCAVSSSAF